MLDFFVALISHAAMLYYLCSTFNLAQRPMNLHEASKHPNELRTTTNMCFSVTTIFACNHEQTEAVYCSGYIAGVSDNYYCSGMEQGRVRNQQAICAQRRSKDMGRNMKTSTLVVDT